MADASRFPRELAGSFLRRRAKRRRPAPARAGPPLARHRAAGEPALAGHQRHGAVRIRPGSAWSGSAVSSLTAGQDYYLKPWIQDSSNVSSNPPEPSGIYQAYLNVLFPSSIQAIGSINHGSDYDEGSSADGTLETGEIADVGSLNSQSPWSRPRPWSFSASSSRPSPADASLTVQLASQNGFPTDLTELNGNSTPITQLIVNPPASTSTTTAVTTSNASVTYGTPVSFTATVTSGSAAPTQGSVDFFDATAGHDLGEGAFGSSTGTTSTWTYATGAKTFNVTTGDTITATYSPGTGFAGSNGTTAQTVTALPITVTAAANSKMYDGTTTAAATPTVTSGAWSPATPRPSRRATTPRTRGRG